MAVQAIFFDFDGVLANTEDLHFVLFAQVLSGLGLTLSRGDYFEHYLGYDDRECFEKFLKAQGDHPSTDDIQMLIDLKAALFQKAIRESAAKSLLFDGVKDTVQELAKRLPLTVVSGALRAEIEIILKNEGLLSAFRLIVAAEDCTHNKPHPEPYERALKELNPTLDKPLLASDVLVVEDSVFGIESGRAAGMRVIGVAGTYPAAALKQATGVIKNLRELPAQLATL